MVCVTLVSEYTGLPAGEREMVAQPQEQLCVEGEHGWRKDGSG